MPQAMQPLSLIKIRTLLCAKSTNLIINPVSLIDPSIKVIVDSFSTLNSLFHLSLVSLSVFTYEYSFTLIQVIFPFAQINISIIGFKYSSSMLFLLFSFSLICFLRWVLHFIDILHKLSVSAVYIILQKRFYNAALLLL